MNSPCRAPTVYIGRKLNADTFRLSLLVPLEFVLGKDSEESAWSGHRVGKTNSKTSRLLIEVDAIGTTVFGMRGWVIFFTTLYTLRFLAEAGAWGLSVAFQKYGRIGVTPLSLEWQPGSILDLYVIPGIQAAVGLLSSFLIPLARHSNSGAVVFVVIVNLIMIAVAAFALGWTSFRQKELANEGVALVGSAAVTRLVAFTWEVWSVMMDITYIVVVSSQFDGGGGRVGFLLFLEFVCTAWEIYAELRNAKITYICGKVLIPISSLDIFESLNTYRAEAFLKSNSKVDGVIAVTTRLVMSARAVQEIQDLVPMLNKKGPLVGGEWFHVMGGVPRDTLYTVKLAVSPVIDSESVFEQDDCLYVLTSPPGITPQSGMVLDKTGSAQFSTSIVRLNDKCARWQGVRIAA